MTLSIINIPQNSLEIIDSSIVKENLFHKQEKNHGTIQAVFQNVILIEDCWISICKQLDFASWKACRFLNKAFHKICFRENVASYLLEESLIPKNKEIILKLAKCAGQGDFI